LVKLSTASRRIRGFVLSLRVSATETFNDQLLQPSK
jgi:hypothetical protein